MINIFKAFLPWIIFSIMYRSSREWFLIAVVAALAYILLFEREDLKARMILTWVTLIYFSALLVCSALLPLKWIEMNSDILSNFVLMAIAFGSLIVKKPFTMQYAKQSVAAWKWQHPLFIQINTILTSMWGVLFSLTLIADYSYAYHPWMGETGYAILTNCIWVLGAIMSKWFPSYWRKIYHEKNQPIEKAQSRFLEGNFAPWREENHYDNLEIIGAIPKDLNGVFIQNGPNPQFDPLGSYHWFQGDGMLHAIYFINGKVQYRNRWVQTERFKLERAAGKSLNSAPACAANTNIISFNNHLLALYEASSPIELDINSLETVGDYTFRNQIKNKLTAHPRYDYQTKELLAYSYINDDGSLHYYRVDCNGKLAATQQIDWPYKSMMHDFVITKNYIVFPVFPTTMSFERLMQGGSIFMWEGDQYETCFIVTDRDGNEVARFFTDPCYVYHFGNAYEVGNSIIIDGMRAQTCALMPDKNGNIATKKDAQSMLARWCLDLKNHQVSCEMLDTLTGEFPRFDERFNGHSYNYLYMGANPNAENLFDRIVRYDLASGTRQDHCFKNSIPREPVFIPKSDKEGDGYVITVVYRNDEDRSDVVILDAQHISEEPIAIIKIPHRIPFGFHGNFMRI